MSIAVWSNGIVSRIFICGEYHGKSQNLSLFELVEQWAAADTYIGVCNWLYLMYLLK